MSATFAQGSSGRIIRKIQERLSQLMVSAPNGGNEPALDPREIDGEFGPIMRRTVGRAQIFFKQPSTGEIDGTLWAKLTTDPWPNAFERALGLLSSFEGHSYTKASGNHDGAGITWGIIGFALLVNKSKGKGPLVELLKLINNEYPNLFIEAFGLLQANVLISHLDKTPAELINFANQVTTNSSKKDTLLSSWADGFKRLGEFPEIQALQDKQARSLYYDQALKAAAEFAQKYDMNSEQTDQLFFDIHVQNGSLLKEAKNAAIAELDQMKIDNPNAPLSEKLLVITNQLIESIKSNKFIDDVRPRKETISRGFGKVHGKPYRLDGWGIEIGILPPKPPIVLRLGVLSFEPTNKEEQLELANASTGLVQPEVAVLLAKEKVWPNNNGTEILQNGKSSSLSFRKLLDPAFVQLIQPDGENVLQAINLVFGDPIGILAVFGQATPLPSLLRQQAIIGRGVRGYAGLLLQDNRELWFVRQRTAGIAAEKVKLNVNAVMRNLSSCQLLILYTGFGIHKINVNLPGQAVEWQNWMNLAGANPIVLGWYGNALVPRDAASKFVSGEFLRRLRTIDQAEDLKKLCSRPERVIQAWGQACYAIFAEGSQRYLWRDEPFKEIPILSSGAAALDPTGVAWYANPSFDGTSKHKAMERS